MQGCYLMHLALEDAESCRFQLVTPLYLFDSLSVVAICSRESVQEK